MDRLRGASRLVMSATTRVVDIVEAMQHGIGGGPEVLGRPFLRPIQVRTLNERAPAAARDAFRRAVESVVLKPVGDGYEATLTLRSYMAALAGGRVGDKVGCGGEHRTSSHTPTPPAFSFLIPLYGTPNGRPDLSAEG